MQIFFKKVEKPEDFEVSEEELAFSKSLTSEKRKNEFLCGRAFLRQIAKEEYGLSDVKVVLEGQKPRLLNNEFFFSISHSKGFLALAVNDSPVGIDIERIDPNRPYEKIIKRFSKEIQNEFYKTPENERLEYFFKLWTEYEAYIKLKGEMLSAQAFNPKECVAFFESKRTEEGYILSVAIDLAG